ncbi:mechanosensitive ion channel family protein [Salegentibacter salarius]|uniref:Mechanosensitive ion channel protein MscS n=1 Tax=Salegentibacter salarius TaxID=435906 RepID=A0A2N0TRI2_9FLAO|nr:mechanosensitive ion channel family protein [Salegentibacter salarius]OEY71759.1 mechanosensitive ion channel protein MscS [Salegentibacter salarius]PKD17352.1 mechanosensitive ion channel protein MscS [Salegentibacter salarius]SLJ89408.1 MscS family membrane protein [Salegentibacter salarius]
MKPTIPINKVFIIFLLLLSGSSIQAQFPLSTNQDKEQETEKIPDDPLGRRTPRGTVNGFIDAMAGLNYNRAARFLNFPVGISTQEEKEKIIQILQRLFDQKGNIEPYYAISNKPSGEIDDGINEDLEKIGSVKSEDGEKIDIFLEKYDDEEGYPIWLFSDETTRAISTLNTANPALIDQILPDSFKKYLWGGVPAGQWIIALVLLALSYFISLLIVSIIIFLLRKLWKKARHSPVSGIITTLKLPVKLYLAVWIFVSLSRNLELSIILRQKFSAITITVGIAAILILLWRLSDFIGKITQEKMVLRGNPAGVSIVLFLQRAAKIAIVAFGIIAILGAVGIDVTTGLAALGIGGIALALGAQKTIENFVGSVTLIADRPIRVGDFCKVGEVTGHIEKIGIRSTRIRTLDRTVVTIPNGAFSSDTIENYAHRDRFRFVSVLNFRYETSSDQLRFLLTELRKVLYAHPKVYEEPARIRFIGFGAHSLDLEVFAYLDARNYDEFLEIREDLMLRMMEVVDRSGTDFAFPSQTIYFGKDKGLSKEKSAEAEAEVENWKKEWEMPLPQFTREQIDALRNKSSYPPEGSSTGIEKSKT